MLDYVRSCEKYAREAGEVLRQWSGRISVRVKAPSDLVTEADLASQRLIRSLISTDYPDHQFVGEEGSENSTNFQTDEPCWIVDPLDGTTNYVHGLPGWCVSIALAERGRSIAGCIYDVERDLCFSAARGEGAHCNGEAIFSSGTENLSEALVAVSFPPQVDRDSPEINSFLELLPRIRAFRRLGSAALNLCYVASGQLDAYWAANIKPWDVAAGVLILQEAGGVVSSMHGQPHQLGAKSIAGAGTAALHRQMVAQLSASIR